MPLFDFRSIYLPYCLKKQQDGSYIIANREYKPVGFNTHEFIKYEDYPVSTKFRISKVTAKKLSCHESEETDTIYLYNDGCVPTHSEKNMKLYLDKIKILAKLKAIHE